MKINQPTFAFTLNMDKRARDGHDNNRWVYVDSYGLEMTHDDDWPVNTIYLFPPEHLLELNDVASMGVQLGISKVHQESDREQVLKQRVKWVLARKGDNLSGILDAGMNVLLYIEDESELSSQLVDSRLDCTDLIVALSCDNVPKEVLQKRARAIRRILDSGRTAGCQLLLSGPINPYVLFETSKMPGISGILVFDTTSDNMIELLRSIMKKK